jgi:hypothetical protein
MRIASNLIHRSPMIGRGHIAYPVGGLRGLGDMTVGPCCMVGMINPDSGTRTTAADCPNLPPCNPCEIANMICTNDPATSDPCCGTGSQGAGTSPTHHAPGPYDPNTNYAQGDIVWDTCGQLWQFGGGPQGTNWQNMHDVQIGAGKVGTTNCVGPAGVTNMDPNWLSSALTNQPGGAPFYMTPQGQAQLAASGNTPATAAAVQGSGAQQQGQTQAAVLASGGNPIASNLVTPGAPTIGPAGSAATPTGFSLSSIPTWGWIAAIAIVGLLVWRGGK